jgi:hypothetical protein
MSDYSINPSVNDSILLATTGTGKVKCQGATLDIKNPNVGVDPQISFDDVKALTMSKGCLSSHVPLNTNFAILASADAAVAINPKLANNFVLPMTEDTTLAAPDVANIPDANQSGIIVVTQGSAAKTLAFATFWKWAGGTDGILTAVDIIEYTLYPSVQTGAVGGVTAMCRITKNVS